MPGVPRTDFKILDEGESRALSTLTQRALISGWIAILVLMAVSAAAVANGRVQVFDTRVGGPYEIPVGTIPGSPLVGTLHFTIKVTDFATGASVLRPEIVVTGTGPGSDAIEIGPIAATADPANPVFNDLATQVDRIGPWVFNVTVNSELGEGSADFPIDVRQTNPLMGILTHVALLALLGVLGFSVRIFLRERSKSGRGNAG